MLVKNLASRHSQVGRGMLLLSLLKALLVQGKSDEKNPYCVNSGRKRAGRGTVRELHRKSWSCSLQESLERLE